MRNEKLITFMGQTLNISQWARKYNLKPSTLQRRLSRGMAFKDALFTASYMPEKITIGASSHTVKQIAATLGIHVNTVYFRRMRGWKKSELLALPMRQMKLTAFGRTQTLAAWSAEKGLTRNTLHTRVRHGWQPEEALTTPPFPTGRRRKGRNLTAFGKTQTLTDWARELGLNEHTLRARIRRGTPPEVALKAPVRAAKVEA